MNVTDTPTLYQWASEDADLPVQSMARVADLEAQGFEKVREHHRYPGTWLMRKAAEATAVLATLLLLALPSFASTLPSCLMAVPGGSPCEPQEGDIVRVVIGIGGCLHLRPCGARQRHRKPRCVAVPRGCLCMKEVGGGPVLRTRMCCEEVHCP